jgi:hypothetical protein
MGHKARNKQPPPTPLDDPDAVRPASRRQNKRKAEEEAAASTASAAKKRVVKKTTEGGKGKGRVAPPKASTGSVQRVPQLDLVPNEIEAHSQSLIFNRYSDDSEDDAPVPKTLKKKPKSSKKS